MTRNLTTSALPEKRLSFSSRDATLLSTACPGQAVFHGAMAQSVKRVLLVEDSDDYALLMTRGLHRSNDFKLLWRAKDGVDAIKFLSGCGEFNNREKFPMPDVMLLDLTMPRKDGLDVLEWLKTQATRPAVVMLTVLENTAFEKKAFALGADAFKVKPYTEDALREFLSWLSQFCDARHPAGK